MSVDLGPWSDVESTVGGFRMSYILRNDIHQPIYMNSELYLCLLGTLAFKEDLDSVAKGLRLRVLDPEKWEDYLGDQKVVFVVENFQGPEFKQVKQKQHKVLALPALLQYHQLGPTAHIFSNLRPIFCLSMHGTRVAFDGFQSKEYTQKLVKLVHTMAGKTTKILDASTTFLITKTTTGDKYDYCKKYKIPMYKEDLLWQLWQNRNCIDATWKDNDLRNRFALKCFTFLRIHFYGFKDDQRTLMVEQLRENGGLLVKKVKNQKLTHVVINRHQHVLMPTELQQLPEHVYVVNEAWFCNSIQNEYRDDERLYLLRWQNHLPESDLIANNVTSRTSVQYPILPIASRGLQQTPSAITRLTCGLMKTKRQPSEEDIQSGDKEATERTNKRTFYFTELVKSEDRYVNTLKILIDEYFNSIVMEREGGMEMISDIDVNRIFGEILPIYHFHSDFSQQLNTLNASWTPSILIGRFVYEKFSANKVREVYKEFLKNYEDIKELLDNLQDKFPAFKIFLQDCKERLPKADQHSLSSLLLIVAKRPNSIKLTSEAILKHTENNHEDYEWLEKAVRCIDDTLQQLNSEKKAYDTKLGMIKLCQSIKNCPNDLISYSNRSLYGTCEVYDVEARFVRKGQTLTLCLFSDTILLIKKRSRRFQFPRFRSRRASSQTSERKPMKFLTEIKMNDLKNVSDLTNTTENRNQNTVEGEFVLKHHRGGKDEEYTFRLTNSGILPQQQFFEQLRQLAYSWIAEK